MASKAKHRRPKNSPVARGLVTAGTGGAVLAFPLLAATTAQAAPAAHTAASAKVTLTPAAVVQTDTPTTYSVVWGDSLSKIADDFSLSGGWQQLYEDNRDVIGGDPCLIHPGLTLTLGTASASEAPADSAADSAPAEEAAPAAEESTDESASADTAAATTETATTTYADNLDGWIRESLDVMAANGIPGSYEGIHRNIMRESSGDPWAINNWDSNAAAGTPSKGLLQVIDPTFEAYHVPGTSTDSYDPVANITAASNYAADRYGSIDNVNGPY
ncbi:LysM peptidoglycan-binding domain-containing protein [Streptomyces sp. NPDC094034]|uniref:LysM peptidoglycan-binding domain-containing protein n=1 Tax=Streptomyces sp. NPDC094034 TaxID=3155309 RepID=UPI00332B96BB